MKIEWIGKKQISSGIYGKCALFDGKSCVKFEKRPIENMYKTKWSVVFPVYITSITDDNQFLINFQSHSLDNSENSIRIQISYKDNGGILDFYTEGQHHNTLWLKGNKSIDLNKWFLVAVTSDGKNIKLYYDAEIIAKGIYTDDSFYKKESTIFAGGSVDSHLSSYVADGSMIGRIDFYDKCLNQECISSYFKKSCFAKSYIDFERDDKEPTKSDLVLKSKGEEKYELVDNRYGRYFNDDVDRIIIENKMSFKAISMYLYKTTPHSGQFFDFRGDGVNVESFEKSGRMYLYKNSKYYIDGKTYIGDDSYHDLNLPFNKWIFFYRELNVDGISGGTISGRRNLNDDTNSFGGYLSEIKFYDCRLSKIELEKLNSSK